MVSGGKHHSGNGDNGSFLSTALGDLLILDAVISGSLGFHSGMSCLNESRLEVNTGSCNANRLLLTCGLIVAGR